MTKKSRDKRKLQRFINRLGTRQIMDFIKDGELMIFQSSGVAITQIGK